MSLEAKSADRRWSSASFMSMQEDGHDWHLPNKTKKTTILDSKRSSVHIQVPSIVLETVNDDEQLHEGPFLAKGKFFSTVDLDESDEGE